MTVAQYFVCSLDKTFREARPRAVPTVPIAGNDLLGNDQALSDVGHARIRFDDAPLELSIECFVAEVELHLYSLAMGERYRDAHCASIEVRY
jgi:hypothetical protein